MREIYLLPFEMAVKDAGAASIMCAYNYVNGYSSCESREILGDILRNEWGFTGYVQSDFFAMKSTAPTLLAGGMVVFAFLVLLALYLLNSRGRRA